MKSLSIRAVLLSLVLVCLLVLPVAAFADADNTIAGAAVIGVGGSAVAQVDSATDVDDVWVVWLTAGQEVTITVEPTTPSGRATVTLLAPGITSLSQIDSYGISKANISGGTYFKTLYRTSYTPARSARFYVLVRGTEGTLGYQIRVRRTSNPAITAPDSNDLPGIPVGLGSVKGIVDSRTDFSDVYRVKLYAGQFVRFRMRAINFSDGNGGWLNLLDPDSTSIVSSKYWTTMYNGKSMYDNAYNYTYSPDEVAVLGFVPPVTAVYYLWVESSSVFANNLPYLLSVEGCASIPGPPTLATLSAPSAPASIKTYTGFSSSGLLNPKHVDRYGSIVTVYAEHLENGVWVKRNTYTTSHANVAAGTKYTVSYLYFGLKGSWRLRAYHKDYEHLASWSPYRYVSVY